MDVRRLLMAAAVTLDTRPAVARVPSQSVTSPRSHAFNVDGGGKVLRDGART